MSDRLEWVKGLKVGDDVCYIDRYNSVKKIKIDKITPTGIIKAFGTSFDNDGYERGSSNGRIMPITPEIEEKWRKKELVEILERLNFWALSVEQLEKIKEIVKL